MDEKNTAQTPLVSFIIPYYNVPVNLLAECLDSILALNLTPAQREIIVVDDGSTLDIHSMLVTGYPGVVYYRQDNQGLSGARNTGIEQARGQYIQFVDADDRLLSQAYNRCLQMVQQQQPHMLLFSFVQKPKECGGVDNIPFGGPVTGVHYMHCYNLRAPVWSYLFKRSVLQSLRFKRKIFHEDELFTPQLFLRVNTMFFTEVAAYYYRQREGSIIRDGMKSTIDKRLQDKHEVILELKCLSGELEQEAQQAMQRRVAQLTMDYLYDTMVTTCSEYRLQGAIQTLKQEGLYPLPRMKYTKKYTWFTRLISCRLLRQVYMWLNRS